MTTFQTFLETVIAIGIILYGVGQYRAGRAANKSQDAQTASDTINLLSQRADAFRAEIDEAKKQLNAQHDEIIRLQEANKHKDALLDQYMKIITNRNPELEKTLKDVRDFLEALNKKIGDGDTVVISQ